MSDISLASSNKGLDPAVFSQKLSRLFTVKPIAVSEAAAAAGYGIWEVSVSFTAQELHSLSYAQKEAVTSVLIDSVYNTEAALVEQIIDEKKDPKKAVLISEFGNYAVDFVKPLEAARVAPKFRAIISKFGKVITIGTVNQKIEYLLPLARIAGMELSIKASIAEAEQEAHAWIEEQLPQVNLTKTTP